MPRNSSLEDGSDPGPAPWQRYWFILRRMVLVALAAVIAALGWLYWYGGGLTIHLVLATTLGIGLTIMMAAVLMGLAFMSSGTGHDEEVGDFKPGEDNSDREEPD